MPQLAPINWIFLFSLFWFVLVSVSAMLWWVSKTSVTVAADQPELMDENKWNW